MVERGTNSDKRRQKCGKTPGRIPAEILQLDEFEPEVEPRTEPEVNIFSIFSIIDNFWF